jgi:hypothetical protein
MTMRTGSRSTGSLKRPATPRPLRHPSARPARTRGLRFALAGLVGVAVALPVSCGGSSSGLIPAVNAGPLKGDFEAVAQAAQSGDCAATATAIRKTRQDFAALPATVNSGLRSGLSRGIENLATRALAVCAQPLPQATSTSTSPSTTTTGSTSTTPTITHTTPTVTSPTTTTTAPGPGGGTPAPTPTTAPTTPSTTTTAPGVEAPPSAGSGQGGGTGPGEANARGGAGVGGAGQKGGE